MVKQSKKYRKSISKSRKYKGGANRKNQNYSQTFTSQVAGYNSIFIGGQQSSPAPASSIQVYNLDPASLRDSMQSYGDAVYAIVDTAQTGSDIYKSGNLGIINQTSNPLLYQFAQQQSVANNVLNKANLLKTSFNNLYAGIYGTAAVFVPTETAPAPAGSTSTTPSVRNPVSGLTTSQLQGLLNDFGAKLYQLLQVVQSNVNELNTPNIQTSTNDGPAFSTFISQKTSMESLLTAVQSTITSFSGTPDYNPSTSTGVRGLYRAILGDTYLFTIPAPAPSV